MIYNRTFIAAVHAVASTEGEDAAREVFNKLFGVEPGAALVAPKSQSEMHRELNDKVGGFVYFSDIEAANRQTGKPYPGCVHAVPWIKAFRMASGFGLRESKAAYDYLCANPDLCI